MRIVGILVSFLAIVTIGSLFSGFVLSVLWAWFIVPALHASPITIAQAIGISLVIGMLTRQSASGNKDKDEQKQDIGASLFTSFCVATIVPLFVLGVGAIVHAFM